MFSKISKVLFLAAAASLCATSVCFADCGCAETQSRYGRNAVNSPYSPEIVTGEVKNYDCSAPMPVYESVPAPEPVMPQPVRQARYARHSGSAGYIPYVDNSSEKVLAPLSREEIDRRSKVVAVREDRRVAEPAKPEPEFLMSSRSERQKIFEGEEKPCRDGSIFGGRPCKSSSKDGSIFGGGPCKSCSKNGSIFAGRPCKTCGKNGSILGGGTCKTCGKNGSILGGSSCEKCKKSCPKNKSCPCKKACPPPAPKPCMMPCPKPCVRPCPQPAPKPTCVKKYELQEVVRNCEDFAPFSMEWVDFRINRNGEKTYSRNLGNYRFRIFGCRRSAKNTILNEGRILEKDMNFNEIFRDMVSDCYKVVTTQQCIDENTVLPEYVLTAEITDYFMNVCDEYNWDDARMENSRNGSSEITVTWRLMDASKTNVLWKGESKGYAELEDGEQNGEIVLIQRAFADAADNLRYLEGFEDQLAVRVSAEEMAKQRETLMEIQKTSGICDVPVVEDAGSVSTGFGIADTWVEVKEVPAVETPEVEVEIVTPKPVVEEVVPAPEPKPVTASAIYESDKICIVERIDAEDSVANGTCKVRNSLVSITNARNEKGVGLLISERFVLTSAKMVDRANNNYVVTTPNGKTVQAKAFRLNQRRSTALLMLKDPVEYTPLALAMELPPVGKGSYVAMGENALNEGSDYLLNKSQVTSYRYTEDGIAEIMTDNFAQGVNMGGILVDEQCRVAGISHRGDDNLFLPFETAIRSLGVEICGKAFPEIKPKVWQKPVAVYIDNPVAKAPEEMPAKARK